VIFGPTNYKKTLPYGEKVFMVRKDLPCSPCYKRSPVKCDKNFACFKEINVEDVLKTVKEILK